MNHFSEMEWNSKWDWENLVAFGSKAIESPKKLQLADWMIVDDGETDVGCFNPSAAGGNSGASGSDGGHVSSAKSSISASTDTSNKDGMHGPNFRFMTFEGFTGNFRDKMEVKGVEPSGDSPKEVSIGSVEPLIGLKLGKRTYFENSSAGGTVKSATFSVTPSGAATLKKNKSGGQNLPAPHCLVEGCNVDLSTAKEYHRKHRVCDAHSKSPKVIVGGLERRFCQQCSRFHGLAEFDEKKRSCRRRLSDHNARRRKPPQETIQYNSTRLSSTFYEGRQQMSFLLSNTPYVHSRNPDNTVWNSICNSKFTISKGHSPKYNVDESTGGHMHISGIKQPNNINMQDNPPNGFLASKSSMLEALSPGSKGSLFSPNLDAAPEYRRALSLLSSNSWSSCEPESMPVHPLVHENSTTSVTQQLSMQAIPEGVPLSTSDFWLTGHQMTHQQAQPLSSGSNFQEIQLFKTPYEANFYSNILN